jgi:solute:Na+ symporter, SSS family
MHLIDYAVILIYLIATIFLGVILERKASQGIDSYFLGNRDLPWWVLGASGMAANIDLSGTMIITALIYTLGTQGFFIEIRGGIVLIMPFLLTFMGKWNRRAKVMTLAEWMYLRFGSGREGNFARSISAIANLVFAIGTISYFAVGGGKFFSVFLGIPESYGSIGLILITLVYTAVSGFYGVVWTDVFQGFLILIGIFYLCILALQTATLPDTFSVTLPGTEQLKTWSLQSWSSITPAWNLDIPGDYAIFNLLGGIIFFYLLKTILEGCSGAGGYMVQRYFAAKSDREVGLLSLFWIILLAFRWPMVTALAILGIHYSATVQPIADPELILPTVIAQYVPIGMKGLLIACFMAAAMSTFNAGINSSAAYWVKDIYQLYIKPQASEPELVFQGRLASVVIVILGILFSSQLKDINDIWGWLTLGLGAGLAIPLLLRWYWWRFNGYGFAIGTLAGMVAAVVSKAAITPNLTNPQYQEYILFLVPSLCSLIGCIAGTLLTPPTEFSVMANFYQITRPFGFWGQVRENFPSNLQAKITTENRRDILATVIALPWQLALFLMGMMAMMKRWDNFGVLLLAFILLSIGLYFTWFRHLDKEVKIDR